MTNITITYSGEEWRTASASTQTLAFSYLISNDPITSADAANANSWTAVHTLDFATPVVNATAAALDGHSPANSQEFSNVPLPGVVVYPGQEVFFRWYDAKAASGASPGLAIDNVSIHFTSVTAIVVPPAIDSSGQPQSRTNNAGTRAVFTVTATGSPLNYRWQTNGTDLADDGRITGTSTASLSISNAVAADAGSYAVRVYNDANSVLSSAAVLTVIDPAVNTQPLSRTNIAGDTANFFVGAAGTGIPLSYQWRFKGIDIAGATFSSLNVLNVQATNQGGYSVVVGNNDYTVSYTTSAVANLTLLATPANTLARWDFNATNVLVATAPVASTGSGTASLINGTTAAFSTGAFSDPAGIPGSDNSGWNTTSYPPQGTSNKTAGVQFNVSTLGFQDILLAWEQRQSATASKYTRLQYTTDGSAFVDGNQITMTSTNGDWVFYVINLSAISGVNNNPNFAFRIVSEWEATAIGNNNSNYVATTTGYGTSGTIRFDLMSVYGNPFTAPTLASTTISNIIGTTLSYGGGAGSQFVLVKSASVAAPLAGWTRVHTNFITPGTFTVPAGSEAAAFYRVRSE